MAVTDDAIEQIRSMIVSGQLRPGQRLPPEQELSENLGISRNSLREAVRALSLIHVLDVRRGDGTYVASLDTESVLQTLAFVTDLRQDGSALERFQVRRILEPPATAIATRLSARRTSKLLGESVDAISAQHDLSIDQLVEHDLAFHKIIAEATENTLLAAMIWSASSQTVRARIWRGLTQDDAQERTLSEHRQIAMAMATGDPDIASAFMATHIAGVELWMQESLL